MHELFLPFDSSPGTLRQCQEPWFLHLVSNYKRKTLLTQEHGYVGVFWRKLCVVWEHREEEFTVKGVAQPSAQQATDGEGGASLDFYKATADSDKLKRNPAVSLPQ